MEKVFCPGCGASGMGETERQAWARVPHEGHGHRQEMMTWEQVEQEEQLVKLYQDRKNDQDLAQCWVI